MLTPQPGQRIPTGVEQHEKWFDSMARRDADKLRKTCLEAARILSPQLIVQKDSDRVEPMEPGPAQFHVDAPGIVGTRLKHLELIDGVGGGEVCADGPTLRSVPTVGPVR